MPQPQINNHFFKSISSWDDFVSTLLPLSKKEKGDAFELLTKYFFLLHPVYSFYDAKIFAKKMNIKTQKEWFDFAKSGGEKPENIPYKPHTAYKSEWKNWSDFLGKE